MLNIVSQVSSLGANPLMLPGLEAWLNSFISEQVMTPFTYPDGVRVNIGDLLGMSVPSGHLHPQGLLAVTVKGATGVPRTDFFGLCDPYVKVYVKKSFANNTSVKSNTLTPIWNEGFEFLVHDVSHQFIHIQLWGTCFLECMLSAMIFSFWEFVAKWYSSDHHFSMQTRRFSGRTI